MEGHEGTEETAPAPDADAPQVDDEPDAETSDDDAAPDADAPQVDDEPDAETSDDDLETEADEAGEVEPEARGPSAADLKRFESENTRHEKALAKIIGGDWAGFVHCEPCGGVGFVPARVEVALELPAASGVMECPTCAGEGGTPCETCEGKGGLTFPTRVEGQRVQSCLGCGGTGMLVCVDCAGNGWKREAPPAVELYNAAGYAPPNGGPQAPPGYIFVKVDPDAPDLAQSAAVATAPAAAVQS